MFCLCRRCCDVPCHCHDASVTPAPLLCAHCHLLSRSPLVCDHCHSPVTCVSRLPMSSLSDSETASVKPLPTNLASGSRKSTMSSRCRICLSSTDGSQFSHVRVRVLLETLHNAVLPRCHRLCCFRSFNNYRSHKPRFCCLLQCRPLDAGLQNPLAMSSRVKSVDQAHVTWAGIAVCCGVCPDLPTWI